jgi:putative hydrolase of the HAD superfamily
MEKNYLQFIKKFLGESSEMIPAPTLLKPYYRPDTAIKALAFDVYGTILISASGDIDESVISTDNLKMALDAAGIELVKTLSDPQLVLVEILESFKKAIKCFHQSECTEDRPYPEVDILKIWEDIIIDNRNRNQLILNGLLCIKCFTFVFEVLSNRIYPMPGLKEVINHLAGKNIPLGIISNAQFYTPVILNFFIHGAISEMEQVPPFDADLTVFSYMHQRSKPDTFLFELLKNQCRQKFGIYADEILFIGNDMFRDIYPAHLAGFKTALFAGDTKSLRLRQDKPELKKITPDYIITDLHQLLKIIV